MHQYSDNVKFMPYVGDHYTASNVRVLLLGESHYAHPTEAYKNFTIDVVERYIKMGDNPKFFNGILRTLYGEVSDRETQFQNICFYNYIQEFVGEHHNDKKTNKMWIDAQPAFLSVLEELQPDAVICFGKTMYNELPPGGKAGATYTAEETTIPSWIYTVKKEIPVFCVTHPSYIGGFNAEKFHNVIKDIPVFQNFLYGE